SYYTRSLDSLQVSIEKFQQQAATASPKRWKEFFTEARYHYKKLEWIVEYHFPSTAQKLNGAALPEAERSEPGEVQHPSGFQVLEELVYSDDAGNQQKILFELSTITNRIQYLQAATKELELTESNILDALKLNLYRLITKGITGFDSPVALNSLAEIIPTLESTKTVLSLFKKPEQVVRFTEKSIAYVRAQPKDFNGLNRAVFIAQYVNPLCKELANYQRLQQIPFSGDERAVNVSAETLFSAGAFNPLFYAPSGVTTATQKQVFLGKLLFNEPLLSSNGGRSCASCHQSEKALTDGLAVNRNLSGDGMLLRNTPTLLNAALQPVQFYDSRIAFLEDQVHDVISNGQEMGGLFEKIVGELNKKGAYRQRFASAYRDEQISANNVRSALAAYVRSLVAMNSPFDRYMRGERTAMTKEQVAGFNLFAGKAKCATCHFIPLFNGTVPPLFDKMESEVLGVPANTDTADAVMDRDSGKYHLYKIPHQLFSFKTPSLRNVALTAPYMHNGVYKTLDQVIDFYERGGGAGLGFALPNQTLPSDKLQLTFKEKQQVISFLHALTDKQIQ
ncbi:MAG TPA: cytochrome c peroxidase, partial [Flavisolibacter sp.]|nr:cytochrome c peroxidase [Flavisolibacter sp.]